jgi:hypothetical protein
MSTHGRDPRIWYDQTKCFIDVFLRDLHMAGKLSYWLETCNVQAAAMAVEAVDAPFKYVLPIGPDNRPIVNQAGLMFAMLYNRYGQANAPYVSDSYAENEDARNVAWVLEQCAYVKAAYKTFKDAQQTVDAVMYALKQGSSIVLSYLTDYGSGHYIALTDVDDDGSIIAFDSWAYNKHCSNGGKLERYPQAFFAERARPRFIEVSRM